MAEELDNYHGRWKVLSYTSKSGCTLFKCKACGRVSKTPDISCRTYDDPNESYKCSVIESIVTLLNELLEQDREAISKLVNHRVEYNLEGDNTNVVVREKEGKTYLGMIGIINGLISPRKKDKKCGIYSQYKDTDFEFKTIDRFGIIEFESDD